MSTLHVNLIGRFGNCMFQYAYARALSEQRGWDLTTSDWIGQEIFDLPNHSPASGADEILPTNYCQDQQSLIYTRSDTRDWFKLKPDVLERLKGFESHGQVLAHRRTGDYMSLGYVVVSWESYYDAARKAGYEIDQFQFEEKSLLENTSFVVDFYSMMTCSVLFRGNSSFSWWAATLGNAKVYSPVIEGLEGGKEQDCKFVEGNWPRFANLPFVTDLHLPE